MSGWQRFVSGLNVIIAKVKQQIKVGSNKLVDLAQRYELVDPPPKPVNKDALFYRYPVLRGMCTYAIIYPIASLMQQYAAGAEEINWVECFHFALFGGLWLAPTMYYWYLFAEWVYPGENMAATLKRAVLEQVVYSPFQIITFFYGMGFIQGQTVEEITHEVEDKFWPTYKVGWVYWPTIQVIDYFANRRKDSLPILAQLVPLIAPMAAFWWGYYLSQMKNETPPVCPRPQDLESEERLKRSTG
uniref:Uncharacterized protein n=1 Tax=Strigamia maritima TaxID=126957 RepID=T1JNV1_STRMM